MIRRLRDSLAPSARNHLEQAIRAIVEAKQRGGRVVAVTGSGPNIHEGVTTQIAELIHKGLVDGVITSSAVVAHEMAGTLDRVKRIRIAADDDLGFPSSLLPRGRVFEVTMLSSAQRLAARAHRSRAREVRALRSGRHARGRHAERDYDVPGHGSPVYTRIRFLSAASTRAFSCLLK